MRKGFFIGSHRSMDQRNRSRQARNYRCIGKVSAEGLDCTLVLRKPDSGWETRWSRQNGGVTMRYFQRWLRWQKDLAWLQARQAIPSGGVVLAVPHNDFKATSWMPLVQYLDTTEKY
jgi:hypothetical protein